MQQNQCNCNDYSLQTANTGIATITNANPLLNGSGTTLVLTGGLSGTIIKQVIIKAIGQVTKGMVRLFISDGTNVSLFKEVQVPTTPYQQSTATPPLVLPTFELVLKGDFKLLSAGKLLASTQNGESFNIIAEGLDWKYPALVQIPPLPPLQTCCNFVQEIANTGVNTISTASSIKDIFTASSLATSNGSYVKTITMKALQSTNLGMVRFYINDGTGYYLFKEIMIPETIQSGFEPAYKQVIELGFSLQNGYKIGAATEIGQAFAFTVEGWDWTYPIA